MIRFALLALLFVPFAVLIGWLVFILITALRAEKRERESPTTFNPNRAYVRWTPRDGWPRGPFLFYECAVCGQALASKPQTELKCECGNLFVDVGRIGASDETKVRLFEERPENNAGARVSLR